MNDIDQLRNALRHYAIRWPDEQATATLFLDFLAEAPAAFARSHRVGHFTGSAWLVSADHQRVLLTHHRKLGRWLQLGGHADGDSDSGRVALREAEEESGLHGLRLLPALFDIDRHAIPARGDEPQHWHYDLRYVVVAEAGSERFVVSDESHALAWRPIAALVEAGDADTSLRRMAYKWLQRDARTG